VHLHRGGGFSNLALRAALPVEGLNRVKQRATTRLTTLFHDLIDFCFAAQCAACDAPATGCFLCSDCDARLDQLAKAPACECCAMPLAMPDAPCPFCRGKGVSHYESIVALGRFEEPLKGLIHRMKYRSQWPIAEHLADRLMRKNRAIEAIGLAERIVAVPLHPIRQLQRGYNQAEVIARRLSGDRIARAVRRSRNTPTQTNLHSHEQRLENLRGAFELTDPEAIAGRRVVVIDDVMTSGGTLQAIARVLKEARPRSLHAVVLAIADPKGRQFQSV
jgi:ComF family protein